MAKQILLNLNVSMEIEASEEVLDAIQNMKILGAELNLIEREDVEIDSEQPIVIRHNEDGSTAVQM